MKISIPGSVLARDSGQILKAEFNRDAIGSDYDYDNYSWEIRQFFEFAEKFTFAWRLDGAITSGDVPFYLEPFVSIQGIPAMRYQGGYRSNSGGSRRL
jgi:hypothetical protein